LIKTVAGIYSISTDRERAYVSSRPYLASNLVVLIVCAAIFGAAFAISLPETGKTALHIGPFPLPHTCTFYNLTGHPCPGCGLTRSIVAAVHKEFQSSLEYHRLGIVVLLYMALQMIHRAGRILSPLKWRHFFPYGKRLDQGIILLACLLLVNWVFVISGLWN